MQTHPLENAMTHLKEECLQVLHTYRFAMYATLLYFMIYLITSEMVLHKIHWSLAPIYHSAHHLFAMVGACYLLFHMLFLLLKARNSQQVFHDFTEGVALIVSVRSFMGGVLFLASYILWIISQTNLKGVLPDLHTFTWDPALYHFELKLGVGHTPWYWLHHWFGSILFARVCDMIYLAWFFITPIAILHQFFSSSRHLANQYILTFVLLWFLLGHIMAVMFSSVGPCFYHWLYPAPQEYQTMMHFLGSIQENGTLTSYEIQQSLAPYLGETNFISSFPSMHVAIAALLPCYARHVHRGFFVLSCLYCLMISVGSVYLGWHYLSDTLCALLLTPLIWYGVGQWLTKFLNAKQASSNMKVQNIKDG